MSILLKGVSTDSHCELNRQPLWNEVISFGSFSKWLYLFYTANCLISHYSKVWTLLSRWQPIEAVSEYKTWIKVTNLDKKKKKCTPRNFLILPLEYFFLCRVGTGFCNIWICSLGWRAIANLGEFIIYGCASFHVIGIH